MQREWLVNEWKLRKCQEAALQAGVSAATMRRWVARGRFPLRADGSPGVIRTLGGQLRFHADVLDAHWPPLAK